MTIKDIVAEYLKANGYDGLYTEECGCLIDDIGPCSDCAFNCQPGYKHASDEEE